VTTEDDEKAAWIKTGALHGLSKDAWKRYSDEGFKHYQVLFPGFKYNMMDLQAAIGSTSSAGCARTSIAARALEPLQRGVPGSAGIPAGSGGAGHGARAPSFTLLLDLDRLTVDRDRVMQALHAERIGTGIHYVALHLHPYYSETYALGRGSFPEAEWISDRTISLPFSTKLTGGDADDVIAAVRKVLGRYAR